MKLSALIVVMTLVAFEAAAETIGFDKDQVGAAPAGWICGVTGRGSPKWVVEADSTAPSKPNVLKTASPAILLTYCLLVGGTGIEPVAPAV